MDLNTEKNMRWSVVLAHASGEYTARCIIEEAEKVYFTEAEMATRQELFAYVIQCSKDYGWGKFYTKNILEHLNRSKEIDDAVRKQLAGDGTHANVYGNNKDHAAEMLGALMEMAGIKWINGQHISLSRTHAGTLHRILKGTELPLTETAFEHGSFTICCRRAGKSDIVQVYPEFNLALLEKIINSKE